MIKVIEQPGSWNFKVAPTVHDYFGDVDLEKTKCYALEIAKLYAKDTEVGEIPIAFIPSGKDLKNLYSDFATRSFIRRWKIHPATP